MKSADTALSTGEVGSLVKLVTGGAEAGVRERWARVVEAKKHADESVTAGRAYVSAYVEFVHYVERPHEVADGPEQHRDGECAAGSHAGH